MISSFCVSSPLCKISAAFSGGFKPAFSKLLFLFKYLVFLQSEFSALGIYISRKEKIIENLVQRTVKKLRLCFA